MKGDGEDVSLPNGDRVPIHFRKHLDPIPEVLHPGGSDEDSMERRALEQQLCLEGRQLTAERVTAHADVEHTEVVSVQHDHSCAGPEDRLSAPRELDEWFSQALSLNAEADGRGLASRNDQGIQPLEVLRCTDFANLDVEAREALRMRLKAPLEGQNADDHQPRFWSSPPLS